MLKQGTVILGRFLQQILFILVLTVFILLILLGILLYPASPSFPTDGSNSTEDPIQTPFVIQPNRLRGQP